MVVGCRRIGLLLLSLAYGCAGSPVEGSGGMQEGGSDSEEGDGPSSADDEGAGTDEGPAAETGGGANDEGEGSADTGQSGNTGQAEDTGQPGDTGTGDDAQGSDDGVGSSDDESDDGTGDDDSGDDDDTGSDCDDHTGDDVQANDQGLGNLACDGDPISTDGIMAGPADVDWWSYQGVAGCGNGNDRPSPRARVQAELDATVCMFARCPASNTSIECATGEFETSGEGDPGCCGTNEARFSTLDCGMTNDESARVFVEIVAGQNASCTAYTLEVRFES